MSCHDQNASMPVYWWWFAYHGPSSRNHRWPMTVLSDLGAMSINCHTPNLPVRRPFSDVVPWNRPCSTERYPASHDKESIYSVSAHNQWKLGRWIEKADRRADTPSKSLGYFSYLAQKVSIRTFEKFQPFQKWKFCFVSYVSLARLSVCINELIKVKGILRLYWENCYFWQRNWEFGFPILQN